jgi:hypothetical protein
MSAVPKLVGRVEPPTQAGRFSVFRRTDGAWIVYDPALPVGARTHSVHETKLEASDACLRASAQATARGEPNARTLHGFKLDWSDPRTWEDNP